MPVDQLIFVSLNGYVLALDRETEAIVWPNDKLEGGYMTLLPNDDGLIASTNG